jgi:hypothetical protein
MVDSVQFFAQIPHPVQNSVLITLRFSLSLIASIGHMLSQVPQFEHDSSISAFQPME